MARIRSIHPGVWTDEDLAAVSIPARLLFLGILTEADDHGVFEWKPITLKMRIFPADNLDVTPLLEELIAVKKVCRFSHDGSELGLVRNFCRFQRPKKPNLRFVLPDQFRTYVGLSGDSSELSPQMEDEGGRMEDEGGKKKENEDAEVGASAPPTSSNSSLKKYAFESGIIRLNKRDFEQWKATFSHIDVPAALVGATPWANELGPNRWFNALPALLAKKNQEAKERLDRAKQPDTLTNDEKFWGVGRIPGIQ